MCTMAARLEATSDTQENKHEMTFMMVFPVIVSRACVLACLVACVFSVCPLVGMAADDSDKPSLAADLKQVGL